MNEEEIQVPELLGQLDGKVAQDLEVIARMGPQWTNHELTQYMRDLTAYRNSQQLLSRDLEATLIYSKALLDRCRYLEDELKKLKHQYKSLDDKNRTLGEELASTSQKNSALSGENRRLSQQLQDLYNERAVKKVRAKAVPPSTCPTSG